MLKLTLEEGRNRYYINEFLHCYKSTIINPKQDYTPIYLFYSFIHLNQDLFDRVNIHSLFALPDEVFIIYLFYML